MPGFGLSLGCCCGSTACDHRGYCLYVQTCGAPVVGDAVAIRLDPSGEVLASGVTDSEGMFCATWDAGDHPWPTPIQIDVTHEDCRLVARGSFVWGPPHHPDDDPCRSHPAIDLCYADVTVRTIDLTTGEDAGRYAQALPIGYVAGFSAFTSCTEQPKRLRRVYGMTSAAILAGSTCVSDYLFVSGGGTVPMPANGKLEVKGGDQFTDDRPCDVSEASIPRWRWECTRLEDWCCQDATFEVGGLPLAGDDQWMALGYCGDPDRGSLWRACDCKPAAEMTFANQGFWPKKVLLSGDFTFYITGPLGFVDPTPLGFSIDAELSRICRDTDPDLAGVGGDGWASGEIAVDFKIGVYYCNGVLAGEIRATKARVFALGAEEGGFPRFLISIKERSPDPPTCLPGQFVTVSACTLGFASDWPVTNPSHVPYTTWTQDSAFDVGTQAGTGCDTHADWSWAREWRGEPGGFPGPPTCVLFGEATLMGPL